MTKSRSTRSETSVRLAPSFLLRYPTPSPSDPLVKVFSEHVFPDDVTFHTCSMCVQVIPKMGDYRCWRSLTFDDTLNTSIPAGRRRTDKDNCYKESSVSGASIHRYVRPPWQ
ncbi:hypothetical protein HBI56_045840 [Parastagonospora nodorum]|uniref:Uncharacterized protein n=1 Tax=Phaeosphaeria nodorum (strain SN15 / ATCC MYA-4574 / FGSC 10173) TaxID=321614 RepID=A0A7U2HV29_PHANO|nr:hypothetical protein HBH56_058990 [Parastagonospora nodorum]QRC91768.1 hypothetical protein JI435_019700 [Parastagonospora nodorum SN15]KAH3930941.1 hypothetical protein HBH54_102920 [Parastagonospora nodorum]KAH3943838.1 hypothetical protein HBH53_166550 [Parastagonospora nodorum]KAH3965372.1 hypothetical protein HBH51_151670 [Parastagonospora nodorum]